MKFEAWQERKSVPQKGVGCHFPLLLHWLETGGSPENVSFLNEHGALQKEGMVYQQASSGPNPSGSLCAENLRMCFQFR